MIDPLTLDRGFYRLIYIGLAGAMTFLLILPLDTTPGHLPGPDLMLCLTIAWLHRRPDYLPPWLICGVFLMLDIMLMRPPGLLTALVLLGSEFLRTRQQMSVETPFGTEWLMASVTIVAVFICQGAALALFAVPGAGLGASGVQAVLSVLIYPVVAFVSRYALLVRGVTPGELDPRGLLR
ncbi:rod shape-determining protein MreD [Rhodovulum bhavnagarense]|uniref:Rod shape-determining protein MreD n=1 Tax=Rhodovulum bhavnagarense TaxID=992286 RepID=A0A4R2RBH3_9RHOB|nr:rod shape-determining protein MreD [Rhodovulum bhavnagarense]TCP60682.1 rod shape-determining protein MreD [Rhodovulum bhavnagarense]